MAVRRLSTFSTMTSLLSLTSSISAVTCSFSASISFSRACKWSRFWRSSWLLPSSSSARITSNSSSASKSCWWACSKASWRRCSSNRAPSPWAFKDSSFSCDRVTCSCCSWTWPSTSRKFFWIEANSWCKRSSSGLIKIELLVRFAPPAKEPPVRSSVPSSVTIRTW